MRDMCTEFGLKHWKKETDGGYKNKLNNIEMDRKK
jgi:hypothetical protein